MKNLHIVTKSFGTKREMDIVSLVGITAGGIALVSGYDDEGKPSVRPFPLEYLTPETPADAMVLPGGETI